MSEIRKFIKLMESTIVENDNLEQVLDKAINLLQNETTDSVEEDVKGMATIFAGGYLLSAVIVMAVISKYGYNPDDLYKILKSGSTIGTMFASVGNLADTLTGWKLSNAIGSNIDKVLNVIKRLGGSPETIEKTSKVLHGLDDISRNGPMRPRASLRNRTQESLDEAGNATFKNLEDNLWEIFELGKQYGTTNYSKFWNEADEIITNLTMTQVSESEEKKYHLYKVYDSDRMTLLKTGNSVEELKATLKNIDDWKPNQSGGISSKKTGYVIRLK